MTDGFDDNNSDNSRYGVPELLIPGGDLEKLKFAMAYGADAVYIGGKSFSLRSGSGNFTTEDMSEAINLAHSGGVRVYVTANAMVHNDDIEGLSEFLASAGRLNPDAFIIADPGVLTLAREVAPHIPIHLSTQANTVNYRSAMFWESMGVKRIVLGRELSLSEIRRIRDAVSCELEAFGHGAMCISYSGRCLLSNFLTGRDANRGECTQSCRWKYNLVEETRPGQYFEIGEDKGKGTYIMNSRDLCMLPNLVELIDAGIDSIKVEGRMKSVHYVASVTKSYRAALDDIASGGGIRRETLEECVEELDRVSHRPYTTGFFHGKPGPGDQEYGRSVYVRNHEFVGNVIGLSEDGRMARVYVRNRLRSGDTVELLNPGLHNFSQTLTTILDAREGREGQPMTEAHANYIVDIPFDRPVRVMSIMRRPSAE